MASIATCDRGDLGHRIELLHPDAATAACCNPPRRLPASAAARNISRKNSSRRWKSCNRGDLRPEQLRGSWAGAFGPTQFMPTAFKRYAVDADGDGRRDVVDDPADLIASTANNLKKDGWQTGQTWGYEVVVPPGFNYMLADRAKVMTIAQWEHLGLKRADGKPFPHPAEKAYLLAPAGAEGPGFLMLQNFRVIMKYNPAEAYALAIGHFADRLRGGAPFVQPWPRQERVLSRAERLELQQLLAQRGFYRGTPDGQFGAKREGAA